MARMAVEALELIMADHRNGTWVTRASALDGLGNDASTYADLRARYDPVLIPEAWEADVLTVR